MKVPVIKSSLSLNTTSKSTTLAYHKNRLSFNITTNINIVDSQALINNNKNNDSSDYFHYKNFRIVQYNKSKRSLGKGVYSEVYLVKSKISNKDYSMKIINKKLVPNLKLLKLEVETHLSLCNDNIIKLYSYSESKDFIYLILEYAKIGNFKVYLQNNTLDISSIYNYTKSLIKVVDYLHNKNIAYCNLLLENILIGKDNVLKICDFKHIRLNNDTGVQLGKIIDLWTIGNFLYFCLAKGELNSNFGNIIDINDDSILYYNAFEKHKDEILCNIKETHKFNESKKDLVFLMKDILTNPHILTIEKIENQLLLFHHNSKNSYSNTKLKIRKKSNSSINKLKLQAYSLKKKIFEEENEIFNYKLSATTVNKQNCFIIETQGDFQITSNSKEKDENKNKRAALSMDFSKNKSYKSKFTKEHKKGKTDIFESGHIDSLKTLENVACLKVKSDSYQSTILSKFMDFINPFKCAG